MSFERKIGDILDTLRNAQGQKGATLLIGAGCSASAGIPTAPGVIADITTRFPNKIQNAENKTYQEYMRVISRSERETLIRQYVAQAKINWAHLGIAHLMREGYISRVLTTNFDPLVLRACGMLHLFPSVYDIAISQSFKLDRVSDPSVFYLHGQHTGFVQIHTEEQFNEMGKRLSPVFKDADRDRPWIVVGYSGESDPVCQQLINVESFHNHLYWICYKNQEPGKAVRTQLLVDGKDAFSCTGYDADEFFLKLCQGLDNFPPVLFGKPFSYLLEQIDLLTPFPLATEAGIPDLLDGTRKIIQRAVTDIEENAGSAVSRNENALRLLANELFMAGKYQELIDIMNNDAEIAAELRDIIVSAHLMLGVKAHKKAKQSNSKVTEELFKQAEKQYAAALALKPDMYEALYNWGFALATQAEQSSGKAAVALFQAAGEKFAAALVIKPYEYEALGSWGDALAAQAEYSTGEDATALFQSAGEKYAAALAIKPNMPEALYNWGHALVAQAEQSTGKAATELFQAAGVKYAAALAIKPNMHEALYSWGLALATQAEYSTGEEATALFQAAGEKYEAALVIKPDLHEALNSWGLALATQAEHSTGEEATALFQAAEEKYEAALVIKPDKHEAMNNWGLALATQAEQSSGKAAVALFQAAGEKYAAALVIKPDLHEALDNWGNALAAQAEHSTGEEATALFQAAGEKYAAALAIKPDLPETLNNWGLVLATQAEQSSEKAAIALFQAAGEKFIAALKIKPDLHNALSNWGHALATQAEQIRGKAAIELFQAAGEKYAAALAIKPDLPETLNNWGCALITQATLGSGKVNSPQEMECFLRLAQEKLLEAEQIQPGCGAYNLACVASLLCDIDGCRNWLEKAISYETFITPEYLATDIDLDNVRQCDWFQAMLETINSNDKVSA